MQNEVKWVLENTVNKKTAGVEILAELFKTLPDHAIKVLHTDCNQAWKTQQQPKY